MSNMPVKDCHTEKLILDTAVRVFFAEGRLNATMHDIAETAGLSRTLINYYFRSKELLIEKAAMTTLEESKINSERILASDMPFREKTEEFIEDFLSNRVKYPYLESFITSQIIKDKELEEGHFFRSGGKPESFVKYLEEIEAEMKAGNIFSSNPVHFMINLFSLMVYPSIMKPLQMNLFGYDDESYRVLMSERKKVIMGLLFHQQAME
jgi:TetR/AcrR family transcriptional regulator